ncbi:eukaryotic translation initiation factor 3 subunit E [Tilletia horrida]|nr:eukaryotic translation initiation factor 3 subunit E [Tilletia horrida]
MGNLAFFSLHHLDWTITGLNVGIKMADYDLTSTIVPFIDRHLAVPLLSYLESLDLFRAQDIAKAQYELARGTLMVDYTSTLHEKAFPNQAAPQELQKQREEAIATNERLGAEVESVLEVIEDPNVASALKQDKAQNLKFLEENYKLTIDQINALYRYGQFHFSCGNYGEASSYLYHFRILSIDPTLTLSSHWGKLAADTLAGEWDRALEELKLLQDQIDQRQSNERGANEALLQKRTWLLHWSLFVFFNHPQGREQLVELFFSLPYLNTIQTTCWWLLRYLVAALVITRRSTRFYVIPSASAALLGAGERAPTSKLTPQAAMRDVLRIINLESYRLKADPIIDFVRELYTNFDFDRAQEELKKAGDVANNDFFLQEHADVFMENARFIMSETYCRIHQKVDITDLSSRLNMSKDDGEKWIVNLIRDNRADAKIDLKENIVHMNSTAPVVYQKIIESTRGFSFRTAAMGQAIDRRAHPPAHQLSNVGGGRGGAGGRGGRGGGRGGRGGASGGRGDRGTQQREGQSQGADASTAQGEAAPASANEPTANEADS